MRSKRKSHIGCCQMCIEMAKTSAKTSKTRRTPPWTYTKAWEREMEVGEDHMRLLHAKRPNSRGQINSATTIYENAILPLKVTKCHY